MICPAYNRSRAILDTIESVRAQTMSDWELIVVSDGSTDDTDRVVADVACDDHRVSALRIDHHGHPSPARNTGIDHASGDVVAYIDHDDRWHHDHLARVVESIDAGADVVATGGRYLDTAGATVFATAPGNAVWHPELQLLGPMFEPSRFAHRRELLARSGRWRTGPGVEDWDLLLRMSDVDARFATIAAHTVDLQTSTTARRGRIRLAHHLPITTFDSARQARAAADRIADPCAVDRLQTAYVADVTAWFDRLRDDPRLVVPSDSDTAVDDLYRTRTDPLDLGGLSVVADRGRYSVAQPVACLAADHAVRIGSAARSIRPRLHRAITTLCSDLGATPPIPPAPARRPHTSTRAPAAPSQPVR